MISYYIYLSLETYFKYKDTCRLKVNTWRGIYYINTNQKKAGIRLLSFFSGKSDFKARDKKRKYNTQISKVKKEK